MFNMLMLFAMNIGSLNVDASILQKTPIVFDVEMLYLRHYKMNYENEKLSTIIQAINSKGYEWYIFGATEDPKITLNGDMNLLEIITQISKQSGYGIGLRDGNVCFAKDSHEINNYCISGPYLLSLDKNGTTGNIEISLFNFAKDIFILHDCVFSDVTLWDGKTPQRLQGEFMFNRDIPAWVSSLPIKYSAGMILKGKIRGPILKSRYIIYGINGDSSCNFDDISIKVSKSAREIMPRYSKSPYNFGKIETYKKGPTEGCWMCINILSKETAGRLTKEEQLFMKSTLAEYIRAKDYNLSSMDKDRYNALSQKVPYLQATYVSKIDEEEKKYYESKDDFNRFVFTHSFQVELCDEDIERWWFPGLYTDIYFDSVQDGKTVFPLKMELLKYEVAEYEFSISIK